MRFVRFLLPLALASAAFGLVAPAASQEGTAPAGTKPAATKPAGTTPAGNEMGWTGVLTEEEFKALHQLKEGQAPPRRGTMVTVGGERAYLSLPQDRKPPMPAVILVHEWWGLNDNVMHFADRLAAEGYAALAVDLYGGQVAKDADTAMKLVKAVDPDRAFRTLDAAFAFLLEAPTVKATRRATMGWCFGGAWSLQYALVQPKLDAAVIYYGRLVTDPAKLKPLRAPVLGIFGNKDEGIPPASVDAFEAALREAGKAFEIRRYDAPHGFGNPSNPAYDERNAAAAWKEVAAFLEKHLT